MNLFQIATRGIDLDSAPITPDDESPREGFRFEEPAQPQQRLRLPSELDEVFALAAHEYEIDPDVLRGIAYAESRFNPDIISGKVKSKAGAIGLMQFMPETAKEYGIEPTDPTQAIIGAAAYLRKSLDKFGGDYERAVASYNWGPNRKAYDSEDWTSKAPEETQKYLQTVFNAAGRFKDGQAERGLPQGMAPSTAGAGRGVVNPTLDAPVTDTGDETARLAARYKAPDAPQQGGFIQSVGDFFKPAPTSVLESYKPTAAEQQAANAQRLRYGTGPIKGDVLVAANEVASGNANSSSPTVNAVAKQMQERGDTFTGYAQSKNTPILKEGARDAKAAEFRSAGEWAVDSVSALAQGSVSIPLLPASIFAPGGDTAKTLRSWRDAWSEQESDVLKAQRVVLKDRIQSEEGFAGKYAATVLELVTNPALGLSEAIKQVPNYLAVIGASRFASGAVGTGFNAIEKSSPTLALANALSSGAVKGGAQATAATAGGMAASVVMTSGDAAGDVYETLTDPNKTPKKAWEQNEDYQALIKQGLSHKAAVMQIAEAKARFAAVVVAPLGLFGFMGAESALATKGIAGLAASFGPRAAVKTFGKEIIGENIEEGGTKWGGNVVTSTVDPRVRWDEGVAEAAATATVTSAPMAGLAARSQLSAPAQAQDSRNGLIAAGLLDPQTYDGGIVGAAGTANPLLEQLKRKPAPTVESQPTTPQVPPTVAPTTPVTPDASKTQAVDNIAAAIKELEGGTTQATPVQPGSQAVDAGAAPVAQGPADTSGGLAAAGTAAVAGQSESAQSLSVTEKGLEQKLSVESTPTATPLTESMLVARQMADRKGLTEGIHTQLSGGKSIAQTTKLMRKSLDEVGIPRDQQLTFVHHVGKTLASQPIASQPQEQPAQQTAAPATGIAAEMAALKSRNQATATVDPAKPAPVVLGRDSTPISEGGVPFATKAEAAAAKKLQPMMRVKKEGKGFVLVEKTAKQIAAQANAARRNLGRVGQQGKPLAAHEFLASDGGLSMDTMADLGFDKNVRVGSRWLFTKTGKTMEGMTEALQQNGYMEGTEQNKAIDLVKRSANGKPQYTAAGWDTIAKAEAEARFEDHLAAQQEVDDLDPFSPDSLAGDFDGDDLAVAGYDAAQDQIKLEVNALLAQAEALGIDTETIRETAFEDTKNESEQTYYERVKADLTRAINASTGGRSNQEADGNTQSGQGPDAQRGSRVDSRQDDGREGAPGTDGEGLTAYTPEEVTARQNAAKEAEATAKRAEEAAARAEAAAKQASEIAQRSVAAADTFELGGNAEDNLSGQEGLKFSKSTESPRTPVSTIRQAITKAYGNLLPRLEGKGLVTLTQTEEEAISAAAQARADQNGGDVEVIKKQLRKSVLASQRAWHGTPHRGIEKFSTDKIGTGEGAQAFGWGLYFADRREIADHYRNALSQVGYDTPSGRALTRKYLSDEYGYSARASNFIISALDDNNGDVSQAIKDLTGERSLDGRVGSIRYRELDQAIGLLVNFAGRQLKKSKGQLYEVDIPEDSDMLLWDKPLSEQPESVQDALKRNTPLGDAKAPWKLTGAQFYQSMARGNSSGFPQIQDDRQASEYLASLGIKGIKYLDGTSRNAGEGSYNYVVFSGEDVQIVDVKYSKDGNLEGFFDPATGKSFLIADNLTAESAPATLMHEVGIHMAADGKFEPMFDRALTVLNDGSLESTEALRRMQESGETSGEEAAAYIVTVYEKDRTNAPQSVMKWMADLMASVRAWLFSKGVLIKADQLTVADIAAVARANASRMAKGENAKMDGERKFSKTSGGIPGLRDVRKPKENLSEVGSAMSTSFKVLGNRDVPMDSLTGAMSTSVSDAGRAQKLADTLKQEGSYFERVIVDDAGNVIEGQHRVAALRLLGAKTVPAVVIQDFMRDFDSVAVGKAMRAAQQMPSDRVNNLIANLAEIYADEKGDIAEVREYEPPRGFEKAWEAGIDALNPTQIKSAIGNNGDFDGNNPDIRRSVRGGGQQAATQTAPAQPVSKWRDSTGRLQFAPGAMLYDFIGDKASPLLSYLGLKMASPALRTQLRRMKAEVTKAQEIAATVATESAKFSEADREMVSDLVEKTVAAGTIPPDHAVKMAELINMVMGKQTDELVSLGMLSKDSADRWRDEYLPRYYESKMLKKDAWGEAMKNLMRRASLMRGIKGKHLKGRGLFETVPVSQQADYESLGWEVRDDGFDPAKDETVMMWRDFTAEERANMGEIKDAGFRFVMGYMQTQKDIALGRMYRSIASDENLSSRLPTDKMTVKVPGWKVADTNVNVYGELAGRYVSPETLSVLSSQSEAQNDVLAGYRKALGLWKEGKTVLNPVSHMNNVVSNITMAHFAGVSYHRGDKYIGAVRDFVYKHKMVTEAKEAGLFSGGFSESELMQSMPAELRALAGKAESKTDKAINTAMQVMTFGLRNKMQNAYGFEDDFFKYLIYKDARSRGATPDAAVDFAQQHIFTYDDLPRGARIVRDTALPFFSYTYKALPALLHTALTQPHRFAVPAALMTAAATAAYAIASGDDDDDWYESIQKYLFDDEFRKKADAMNADDQKRLPPWMKGYMWTLGGIPRSIRVGYDNKLDKPVFLDVSRMMPGGTLIDVSPNSGGIPLFEGITPSHPMLSIGTAMLGNRDLFTGKDVVDKTDNRLQAAKKRADWMWKQIAPAITVGNYHYERVMNMIAQQTGKVSTPFRDYTGIDRMGMPTLPEYGIPHTFGIKLKPIDLELSEQITDSQNAKLIRELDAKVRSLQRMHRKGAVSDEDMSEFRADALEKRKLLRQGLTIDGDER